MCHKTCTKCHTEYPCTTEYFHRDKNTKDGLITHCKKCKMSYQKSEKGRLHHYKANKKYYRTIKGHLQNVYHHIKQRCNDPKDIRYGCYGGRGIKNKFESLNIFRDYVLNVLKITTFDKIKNLQIDRIDNDGHYESGNIRFVTCKENNNNRRERKSK